ncbi:MAG: hypothetical protein LBU87_05235 [Lactobacillales bacterium]|jgi:hypothetical protein|nr:hypothetical protein [Lactobacillales bacterium]
MSKRETVLKALFKKLSTLENIPVFRNETLPQKIPKAGIVFLRDGQMSEPEILLSPPLFIYQHTAEIEVIVQDVRADMRDTVLDGILTKINGILSADTTLGGNVDYMYPKAPEFIEETIEGAPTIKAAVIPVVLEYASSTSLT